MLNHFEAALQKWEAFWSHVRVVVVVFMVPLPIQYTLQTVTPTKTELSGRAILFKPLHQWCDSLKSTELASPVLLSSSAHLIRNSLKKNSPVRLGEMEVSKSQKTGPLRGGIKGQWN